MIYIYKTLSTLYYTNTTKSIISATLYPNKSSKVDKALHTLLELFTYIIYNIEYLRINS